MSIRHVLKHLRTVPNIFRSATYYLPLYVTCGPHILCGRLRTANRDGADGALKELKRIVGQIRQRWPRVRVIVRGDSGFCREELMVWCEGQAGEQPGKLGATG